MWSTDPRANSGPQLLLFANSAACAQSKCCFTRKSQDYLFARPDLGSISHGRWQLEVRAKSLASVSVVAWELEACGSQARAPGVGLGIGMVPATRLAKMRMRWLSSCLTQERHQPKHRRKLGYLEKKKAHLRCHHASG